MDKLLAYLKKVIIKTDYTVKNFKGLREQVFLITSFFILLLGLVSSLYNIFFSITQNFPVEALIYILAFLVLLISIFGKRVNFYLRIFLIMIYFFLTGVVMISIRGLMSSGQFFLFLIPVIAAVFQLKKTIVLTLVLNPLVLSAMRFLVIFDVLSNPDIVRFSTPEWFLFSVGFALVNISVTIFLYHLIRMLITKSDKKSAEVKNLNIEMEKLSRINKKFQSIIDENKEFQNNQVNTQRLDSVARLTSGIAHEFNNFITVIIGYTDILLSISSNDEMYNKLLRKIKVSGKSAENLVSKLLAFSKNMVMKNRIVNVNDILLNHIDVLNNRVNEKVKINLILPEENYLIKIDPKQFENMINELITNANHALPKGGEIRIKVDTEIISPKYAKKQELEQDGEYVVLTVEDNGIGMDKETLSHIFEPFFSTKGSGESLGLGMSVIYGIVKQSGGDIEVKSSPGKGTKVKLYFLSRQEKLAFKKNEQIIPTDLKGDERILLVEDDKLVRSVIVEVLTNYGYKMITAANGVEGLETFAKMGNDIDLIIADVVMPKMSGIDLINQIKNDKPEIKSLYMSGYSEQVNNLDDMGVNYIKKPFDPLDLVKMIRIILDTKPVQTTKAK
ncbi:MAG: ATP-binding protein [Fidelibacterota bacterium]